MKQDWFYHPDINLAMTDVLVGGGGGGVGGGGVLKDTSPPDSSFCCHDALPLPLMTLMTPTVPYHLSHGLWICVWMSKSVLPKKKRKKCICCGCFLHWASGMTQTTLEIQWCVGHDHGMRRKWDRVAYKVWIWIWFGENKNEMQYQLGWAHSRFRAALVSWVGLR